MGSGNTEDVLDRVQRAELCVIVALVGAWGEAQRNDEAERRQKLRE